MMHAGQAESILVDECNIFDTSTWIYICAGSAGWHPRRALAALRPFDFGRCCSPPLPHAARGMIRCPAQSMQYHAQSNYLMRDYHGCSEPSRIDTPSAKSRRCQASVLVVPNKFKKSTSHGSNAFSTTFGNEMQAMPRWNAGAQGRSRVSKRKRQGLGLRFPRRGVAGVAGLNRSWSKFLC